MKPFLKWVGGKTQIIDVLLSKFPKQINNYYEPFIGGGSVLLAMLSSGLPIQGRVIVGDTNETLIHVYKNIQANVSDVVIAVNSLKDEYFESETPGDYYYEVRNGFNSLSQEEKNSTLGTAFFIFLNKTCFRGLYRVNSKNGFNVPYGNYIKPEIINEDHLREISDLIKNVEFKVASFEQLIPSNLNRDDFVYFDPPYDEEKTDSFTSYTSGKFGKEQTNVLKEICLKLKKNSVSFLLSNSNTPFVRELFSEFKIETIECKRRINSTNPDAKTLETLIF